MASRVKTIVSCTPIETLTDENGETHDIVASEVGRSLGASGNSLTVTAYDGIAANQGFLNKIVNYKVASHSAGGTQLSATNMPTFVYIENTGYKFSDAITLGAATTDVVVIALQEQAFSDGVTGGYTTSAGTGQIHYYFIAYLAPGQGVIIPTGNTGTTAFITQFGSNAGDITPFGLTAGASTISKIYMRTYTSAGAAATSGNAVKYLVVT